MSLITEDKTHLQERPRRYGNGEGVVIEVRRSGEKCCNVGCGSMIDLKSDLLMECKIMEKDLDGTSEHGERFDVGRRTVDQQRLFAVGEFPFLLSLLILLYSNATGDFGQYLDSSLCHVSARRFWSSAG